MSVNLAVREQLAQGRATTPGRLSILRIAVVAICLVIAAAWATSAQDRSSAADSVATRNEPLSAVATEIYRSLADADATAATGFLSGGLEPQAVRDRYDTDIARAAESLAQAGAQVGVSGPAAGQVSAISAQLPVYTGLVEAARANNRQGLPVGQSYLRRASDLMQSTILPAAEELHGAEAGRLDEQYARAGALPVLAVALGLGGLVALVYAQRRLFRATNRVVNVGLAAATVALAAGLVWTAVSVGVASAHLDDAQRHSDAATDALGEARIAVLQARGNESLALVARRGGGQYEEHFDELAATTDRLLAEAQRLASDDTGRGLVEAAAAASRDWRTAHDQVRALDDSGDYVGAVAMVTGGEAQAAFTRLDQALGDAVAYERGAFRGDVGEGQGALDWLAIATGVLAVLAAIAAARGIGRRLDEYR